MCSYLLDSFLSSMFSFQGASSLVYLISHTNLWRLRDSNSRPPACKAGALPSELNPRILFQMGSSGLEPPTSRLSGARSNRLSYEPIYSGSHLLSRAVSSQVSSAACVLTVVFGMGTGVSHKRIATGISFSVYNP